jgi:hypothetical protein
MSSFLPNFFVTYVDYIVFLLDGRFQRFDIVTEFEHSRRHQVFRVWKVVVWIEQPDYLVSPFAAFHSGFKIPVLPGLFRQSHVEFIRGDPFPFFVGMKNVPE